MGDLQNIVAQHVAHTSQGGHADNHTHTGAGNAKGHRLLAAVDKGHGDLLEGQASLLLQRRNHQYQNDAHQCGKGDRVLPDNHVDHSQEGNSQVSTALHSRLHTGELILRHTQQAQLFATQIHRDEHAEIVQQSRDQARYHDIRIRNTDVLCHNKAGSAHNRRHQLATSRSAGLNSASKLRGIAAVFHQRNGEGTGTHYVGGGSAGNGTKCSRGHNSHLSRAAGGTTGQAQGYITDKVAHAAFLEQRTEEYKQRNISGCGAKRTAKNTLRNHEHMIRHTGQATSFGLEHARHIVAKVSINQEHQCHQRQRGAD